MFYNKKNLIIIVIRLYKIIYFFNYILVCKYFKLYFKNTQGSDLFSELQIFKIFHHILSKENRQVSTLLIQHYFHIGLCILLRKPYEL